MSKILITGANRGIGLALAQQLQQAGHSLIVLCRQASSELQQLELRIVEKIDVQHDTVHSQIQSALEGESLDVVINNAGVMERNTLEDLDFESMDRQFQVNALGPLRVVQACLPSLKQGGKILMVTSRMGSIADNSSGGSYGYRMSKTALNMATVSLAQDLKARNIAVGLVHPGYVKTDMTQQSGQITPAESAAGIIQRLADLSLENSGQFWHQNGETLPW